MPENVDTEKPAQVSPASLMGHFEAASVAELTEAEDKVIECSRLWTRAQTDRALHASLTAWDEVMYYAATFRRANPDDDGYEEMDEQERADYAAVLRLHEKRARFCIGKGLREGILGRNWTHREMWAEQFRDLLPEDLREGDEEQEVMHDMALALSMLGYDKRRESLRFVRGLLAKETPPEKKEPEEREFARWEADWSVKQAEAWKMLDAAHAIIGTARIDDVGMDDMTAAFVALTPALREGNNTEEDICSTVCQCAAILLYGEAFAAGIDYGHLRDGFTAARAMIAGRDVPGVYNAFLALAVAADTTRAGSAEGEGQSGNAE